MKFDKGYLKRNEKLIIGITGTYAAGKTFLIKALNENEEYTVYSEISRQIVENNEEKVKKGKKVYGKFMPWDDRLVHEINIINQQKKRRWHSNGGEDESKKLYIDIRETYKELRMFEGEVLKRIDEKNTHEILFQEGNNPGNNVVLLDRLLVDAIPFLIEEGTETPQAYLSELSDLVNRTQTQECELIFVTRFDSTLFKYVNRGEETQIMESSEKINDLTYKLFKQIGYVPEKNLFYLPKLITISQEKFTKLSEEERKNYFVKRTKILTKFVKKTIKNYKENEKQYKFRIPEFEKIKEWIANETEICRNKHENST